MILNPRCPIDAQYTEIGADIPKVKDKACWSWLKIASKKVLEKTDK
jgi:hypothetical protein